MPVTTHSVNTLSKFFQCCYSKCSAEDFRVKCFSWLCTADLSSVCATATTELLLRLIANDNVNITPSCHNDSEYERLRGILFDSNEKCILFSEFEIDNIKNISKQETEMCQIEIVTAVEQQVQDYFRTELTNVYSMLTKTSLAQCVKEGKELLQCIQIIHVATSYLDIILKYNIKTRDEVEMLELYTLLKRVLTPMYSILNATLQSQAQIPIKINSLQLVKELLIGEFDYLLTSLLRSSIDGDLFHGINNIINAEVPSNYNDVSIEGDEDEMNMETLKHNCFFVLAAYCRKEAEYREEILKLILDDSVYNHSTDLQCIFQTMDILIDPKVEDPPLGKSCSLLNTVLHAWDRHG